MRYLLLAFLLLLPSDQYSWNQWSRQIETPKVRMVQGRDFVIFYSPGRIIYYGKGQQATEVNW